MDELRLQLQDADLTGDLTDELDRARRVLARYPGDPVARLHECSTLALLGRADEARVRARPSGPPGAAAHDLEDARPDSSGPARVPTHDLEDAREDSSGSVKSSGARVPEAGPLESAVLEAAVEAACDRPARALEICPDAAALPIDWRFPALSVRVAILLALNRPDEAEKVARLSGGYLTAKVLNARSDFTGALAASREADDDLHGRAEQCVALRALGREAEEEKVLRTALDEYPDCRWATATLAGLQEKTARRLIAEGKLDQALTVCIEALDDHPENLDLADTLGDICESQARYEEQYRVGTEMIRRDPADRRGYVHAADSLNATGQSARALTFCDEGLAIAPDDPALLTRKINAYLQAGPIRKGIPIAHRLIELTPDSADGHLWLARLLRESGELQAGLEAIEEAVRREPDSGHVRREQVRILIDNGLDVKAESVIAAAPDRDGNAWQMQLADLRVRQNRSVQALEILDGLTTVLPEEETEYCDIRSRALRMEQRYLDDIEFIEQRLPRLSTDTRRVVRGYAVWSYLATRRFGEAARLAGKGDRPGPGRRLHGLWLLERATAHRAFRRLRRFYLKREELSLAGANATQADVDRALFDRLDPTPALRRTRSLVYQYLCHEASVYRYLPLLRGWFLLMLGLAAGGWLLAVPGRGIVSTTALGLSAVCVGALVPLVLVRAEHARTRRRFAVPAVITELTPVLLALEDGDFDSAPATWRAYWVARVETAARILQGHAARHLAGRDKAAGTWMTQRAQENAAALRQLKPLVMTPVEETGEELRTQLRTTLTALAHGRLGELPRCPAEPAARRVAGAGLSALRLLAGTFLPALLVIAYRLAGLEDAVAPVPALVDVIALALWPTVSLLVRLDPEFVKTIGVTRDLGHDLRSPSGPQNS